MFLRPCATINSSASALQARAFHGTYLDPNLEIQIPLQVAAEREIARSYFAAAPGGRTLAAADWNVNITEFAHPPVTAEHDVAAHIMCLSSSLHWMPCRPALSCQNAAPAASSAVQRMCYFVLSDMLRADIVHVLPAGG